MIKNFKWLVLVSLTFVACNSNDDETVITNSSDGKPLTAGSADFSKYISLGNSLCAGYSDGALFIKGQEGSYPNILAQQFALVGGGEFKIPYMADNVGGFTVLGTLASSPRLFFNGSGPAVVPGTPTTEIANHLPGSYNNMGVPGAKSYHLIAPGYGNPNGLLANPRTANPYFVRFASSTTATVLDDALAQSPTFFSLWIGNNDVLGYATSGGDASDPITPTTTFDFAYNALITGLTASGAKGVVANIPYVTSVPFFTTVPYNAVPLSSDQVSALNSGYATYNGGLQVAALNGLISAAEVTRRTINFQVGQNAVVIVDEYLTNLSPLGIPSYRQATAQDYVLLSSQGTSVQAHLAAGNGTQFPLADRWVLSKDEVMEVKTATDAYNVTIQALATAKGLAFVDANAVLGQVANGGLVRNNYTFLSTYVTGGAFSLDGVHPSPRGYALIANEFIKSINTTYGSNLKGVDVGNYQILYPLALP